MGCKGKKKKPKRLSWVVAAALAATLTSCAALAKMEAAAGKAETFLGETSKTVAAVNDGISGLSALVGEYKAWIEKLKAMDSNSDGRLSLSELLAGLGTLGAAGGYGLVKLNAARKERTDELYELNAEHAKALAALEARLAASAPGKPS